MIRFTVNRSFRRIVAIALVFCLVYSPIYSLPTARAEATVPSGKPAAPQPITKPHKPGEVVLRFKDNTPQQVREQIVATYAKHEKKLRGRSKVSKLTIKDGFELANTITVTWTTSTAGTSSTTTTG